MERYRKLNFDIDLSKYADRLLLRVGNPIYNPIDVDELCDIVPELKELSLKAKKHDLVMLKPKTMTTFSGIYGEIHIDSAQNTMEIIDLGMNIPIENGTSMVTRWYNFDSVDNSDFLWTYGMNDVFKTMSYEEKLTRQIDSMLLDGPYLFYSGEPHNVDGTSSTVNRSILSIRWWDEVENRLVRWADRQRLIDIIEN
jgi:hypothetical protein